MKNSAIVMISLLGLCLADHEDNESCTPTNRDVHFCPRYENFVGYEAEGEESTIISMEEWSLDTGLPWRTLNCMQCFEANGRSCVRKDLQPISEDIKISRDEGDQICCALGNFEGLCSTDESNEYICSDPFEHAADDQEYSHYDILTDLDGSLVNHQYFAFCEGTNHGSCFP